MSITKSIHDLGRPVAFYPQLARFLGGIPEALIVCQFLYWSSRKSGEIYKTADELEEETSLSYYQQRSAFKRLAAKGYVVVAKKGMPAKNYYKWNWEKLDRDFHEWLQNKSAQNTRTSPGKTPSQVLAKTKDLSLQNSSTTSEITTESTTETTTDIYNARTRAKEQEKQKTPSSRRKTTITEEEMVESLPCLSPEVAGDYLAYRKAKRAPLTRTAWSRIVNEVMKSKYPPDECLAEAMAAGWQGFKADWLENRANGGGNGRKYDLENMPGDIPF